MNHEINKILYKTSVISISLIIVLLLSFGVALLELKERRKVVTCDSFSSYRDAREALPRYPGLDGNNNGIPCEELYKVYITDNL